MPNAVPEGDRPKRMTPASMSNANKGDLYEYSLNPVSGLFFRKCVLNFSYCSFANASSMNVR